MPQPLAAQRASPRAVIAVHRGSHRRLAAVRYNRASRPGRAAAHATGARIHAPWLRFLETRMQLDRKLMSGDEAVALAARHGHIKLGTGYPGTPSTEILEACSDRKSV